MTDHHPPHFTAERIARTGCTVGETPVWEPEHGRVTWVDSPGAALYRITYPDGVVERFDLPLRVGALAIHAEGGFIASTERGFARLSIVDGVVELEFGAGPDLTPGWRMNDGACDRQGRFWSGSMAPDTSAPGAFGTLFSIETEGKVLERGGRFRTQNGLAWSPDGKSMYVSDSNPINPHVMVHDYDPATGDFTNGRLFADKATLGGRPDGAAMDVDVCYWIAASDSGRVLRMTPGGKIDTEIRIDVPNPTNICFIGSDLKTAFITTLRAGGTGQGGDVYVVDLPYQGLAEPRYDSGR
ncbi:SMP-30/gluconolactonase/LRE family protein [Agrobacterium rosae]|uniref:Gluconolactonase n=3 Tax=Agrobacterium rosae TaxID=1972867 RepID=A0AAE5RVR3_9HYPH|nr:SMP-30/gluconolactonase/LRE family protein [Agrobacterium rosae]MBN7804063.1 SMP-30/gluconolactonase/LRE family protein [Agrobacterium rosae]MCM2431545.1 SMP-30/gluconolactonase/LRE family protein [Agrobacterium rosae]MDX8328789.1 SMP-30/gluconolactonase/LRE family protein [Agrobacterium rosae]MQB46994.1 SMP-30/gluconolactonase/LRE family protein [Agrobacterium rosae]POO50286.1 gluconolactonase [Agrobacterium rosae]